MQPKIDIIIPIDDGRHNDRGRTLFTEIRAFKKPQCSHQSDTHTHTHKAIGQLHTLQTHRASVGMEMWCYVMRCLCLFGAVRKSRAKRQGNYTLKPKSI